MSKNNQHTFYKMFFLFLFGLIGLSGNVFGQQKDVAREIVKLPPAHFIRSRDFDMQHIALDLKFDWEKEQTFGTAAITLTPLLPNLQTINLDAGRDADEFGEIGRQRFEV